MCDDQMFLCENNQIYLKFAETLRGTDTKSFVMSWRHYAWYLLLRILCVGHGWSALGEVVVIQSSRCNFQASFFLAIAICSNSKKTLIRWILLNLINNMSQLVRYWLGTVITWIDVDHKRLTGYYMHLGIDTQTKWLTLLAHISEFVISYF